MKYCTGVLFRVAKFTGANVIPVSDVEHWEMFKVIKQRDTISLSGKAVS